MSKKRKLDRVIAVLLGTLATSLELTAATTVMWREEPWLLFGSLVLHIVAGLTCVGAAWFRAPLSQVESDIVLLTAMFVPVFGPMIAWTIPVGDDGRRLAGSSEMLHRVEEDILSSASVYERQIYSGDFDSDLSRELNAMSYYEVLRSGDLDQKRNALRKLAQLGEPRHMRMIKNYFEDPEPELRLCAYLEIDRLRTHRETHIAELRQRIRAAKERAPDPVALAEIEACATELAESLRSYGMSGILDESMARYRLQQALQTANSAHARFPDNWRLALVKSRVYCDLGDYDNAEQALLSLPDAVHDRTSVQLARASLHFHRRQFGEARKIARELDARGQSLPEWLEVLLAGSPEAPASPPSRSTAKPQVPAPQPRIPTQEREPLASS